MYTKKLPTTVRNSVAKMYLLKDLKSMSIIQIAGLKIPKALPEIKQIAGKSLAEKFGGHLYNLIIFDDPKIEDDFKKWFDDLMFKTVVFRVYSKGLHVGKDMKRSAGNEAAEFGINKDVVKQFTIEVIDAVAELAKQDLA